MGRERDASVMPGPPAMPQAGTDNPVTPDAPPPGGPAPETPVGGSGRPAPRRMRLLRLLGLVLLGAGTVGIFVPLLPTTIFWILAAFCFGRSDPRLQAWIFSHHRFGAGVEAFVTRGILSRKAKAAATAGIAASFALSWTLLDDPITRTLLGLILAGVVLYILTRREG